MSSCSLIQVYKYITHSIAKIKKAFFLFQLFDGHKSQSILVPINFSPDSIKKTQTKINSEFSFLMGKNWAKIVWVLGLSNDKDR